MFFLSILLIFVSSYLLLSLCMKNEEKNNLGMIYFLLIAFSQIILTFEILSLFGAIGSLNFVLANFVFFIVSLFVFRKYDGFFYKPDIRNEFKKIIFALKLDKFLAVSAAFFILFLLVRLFLALFLPVNFGDALSYYFPRCTSWLMQGSLNHFPTPDSRELIMPINFDLLYLWLMMMTKKIMHVGIFSYVGFIGTIFVLYNFVREIGFSVRRSIWSVFVFSSFALVSVETYTPISDLTAGGLILTSLYLYFTGCKQNKNISLFFASLSYVIAVGVKTTALIALPALLIPFVVHSYVLNRRNTLKNALKFIGFMIFNFVVFSSYNFILNYIWFGNPISNGEQFLLNSFRGGFKGWLCSVIKYFFMLFDTSGIHDFINFNGFVMYLQALTLSLFGENVNSYTSEYFPKYFFFSERLSVDSAFFGMSGLFAFLPSLILSLKRTVCGKLTLKRAVMCSFGVFFILSVLIFSATMVFTGYNARYLLTFAVAASPILIYIYVPKKCFYKFLLTFVVILYFMNIPVSSMRNMLKNSEEAYLYSYVLKHKPDKIALMIDQGNAPMIEIEKLKLNGIVIDKLLPEKIGMYDLSEYEYILADKYDITSTNIQSFSERINYSEDYVNECTYWDMNARQIYSDKGNKPAMVLCSVPVDYFERSGFEETKEPSLRKYVILKRKTN